MEFILGLLILILFLKVFVGISVGLFKLLIGALGILMLIVIAPIGFVAVGLLLPILIIGILLTFVGLILKVLF